jgi:hypothetical protein
VAFSQEREDALDRLHADAVVAAFVADALVLTEGDAERAADLMLLRLAQARPEDAPVLRLVVAEALALAALDRPTGSRDVRVRAAALCDRSQDILARAYRLRAWANECRLRLHELRALRRAHGTVPS